jgi:hypothetical protein
MPNCCTVKSFHLVRNSLVALLHEYRYWTEWWSERHSIQETRKNYRDVLQRLKKRRDRPLKVLFLFTESSKWKYQSLFDAMAASKVFLPMVAFTKADVDASLGDVEFAKRLELSKAFCKSRGMRYVEAYSVERGEAEDLSKFSPDLVFYPLPWYLPERHTPKMVSKFALTFYVPYYLVCHAAARQDSQTALHRYIFGYFVQNQYWTKYFTSRRFGFPIAGHLIGLGHPALDSYADVDSGFARNDTIIYAPHWSICGLGERYSTFLETGKEILDYAQSHSELKWCFKPHPTLRSVLKEYAHWSDSEINAYWSEWEKIGEVCTDGSYPALFKRSRAMITDCSSFLVEYSAVDRPLIHLISPDSVYEAAKPCRKLFDSFYKVHDVGQLRKTLSLVIEDFRDPKATLRREAICELNLWHSHCADTIAQYLLDELR